MWYYRDFCCGRYLVSYDKLTAWVDNSLDRYRPELQRILYPLFIHCYLELIDKGATATANTLVQRHKRHLVDMGARVSKVRSQEIQELQSVAVPQHLQTHRFAKTVRSGRHTIRSVLLAEHHPGQFHVPVRFGHSTTKI